MGCGPSSKTKPIVDEEEEVKAINIVPGSPPIRPNKKKNDGHINKNNNSNNDNTNDKVKKTMNKGNRSPSMRSPGGAGRVLKPTMSLNRAPSGYKGLARSKLVRSMIVKYFKDTDEDNDGRINHEELLKMYEDLTISKNTEMTLDQAMILMKEMDRKQDSSVLMEFEVVGSCMRELGNLDTKKIERTEMSVLQLLVYSIVEKVENMSIALHMLFDKFANEEKMLTKRGMKKLLTSVASEDDDKPTKNEIEVFVKFMDKNDDGEIEEKEFISYMTRGFTQPKANIAAFCRRSSMHRKIYSFLFNIENSMADREVEIMEIRKGMNEDSKDQLMALAVA